MDLFQNLDAMSKKNTIDVELITPSFGMCERMVVL